MIIDKNIEGNEIRSGTGHDEVADHPEGGQEAQHGTTLRFRLELGKVRPRDGNAATDAATKTFYNKNTLAIRLGWARLG